VTRARAPGKVVLSGAYAVLAGAPAIVSAVSRDVTADASRPATFVTDEVRAALAPGEQAPWFDASELREHDRKLGLGSSAAILVASLFALELAREAADDGGQPLARVHERAMRAHRQAQGGGSGIDVAASTFGGTFIYGLGLHGPNIQPVALPNRMTVELWTCPTSAATRELLAAVAELAQRSPDSYARWMGSQILAAHDAVRGALRQDARALIAALRAQARALSGLGDAAQVPIVTPALAALAARAEAEGGVLLPAGAGGGDIALFVGAGPSTPDLRAALENHAHRRLAAELGAPGVSRSSKPVS
jgi:phosphomevalonate kinase